jgi:stringent starvation protein B
MLSNKPYLIRAFYDWIADSGCTPYVVINALFPRTKVPTQFIDENNQITLNASPDAVRDLKISNDFIEFRASFSGVVHFISAPIQSVLAVYAQENGEGMYFDFEEETEQGGWEGSAQDLKQPKTETVQAVVQESKKKIPSYLKIVD